MNRATTTNDEEECTGAGKCHGCLRWCSICGDVGHVCDSRLRGERCDAHLVPPEWSAIRAREAQARAQLTRARAAVREAEEELQALVDEKQARRAFDQQRAQEEREVVAAIVGAS